MLVVLVQRDETMQLCAVSAQTMQTAYDELPLQDAIAMLQHSTANIVELVPCVSDAAIKHQLDVWSSERNVPQTDFVRNADAVQVCDEYLRLLGFSWHPPTVPLREMLAVEC